MSTSLFLSSTFSRIEIYSIYFPIFVLRFFVSWYSTSAAQLRALGRPSWVAIHQGTDRVRRGLAKNRIRSRDHCIPCMYATKPPLLLIYYKPCCMHREEIRLTILQAWATYYSLLWELNTCKLTLKYCMESVDSRGMCTCTLCVLLYAHRYCI